MGDAIIWWLTLEVLGLAAWPVGWIAMRRLPDRGWAFSKPLGLLLVGYAAWLIGMFQLVPFSRGSNILMLLVLFGGAGWLVLRNGRALGREMAAWLRAQRRYWITAEILFALAFAAWAILRAYSPNIYGTEKFMDFAFLNSFTQGQTLPPQDPWLIGYSINYYYFGYTLMATLCHLSGVDSAVGFNLANVTLFSLTFLGAFGLVYNLVAGTIRSRRTTLPARAAASRVVAERPAATRVAARAATVALPVRPVGAGGVAVAEVDDESRGAVADNGHSVTYRPVGVRGNGDAAPPNGHGLPAPGAPPGVDEPAPPWAAIATGVLAGLLVCVVGNMAGADQVINGHQTADTFNWWNPSRVVVDAGAPNDGQTINEFPFFSFFLNDMHPHLLALPLVLLVLGLGLALLKAGALRPQDAAGALARRRGLLGPGLENRLRLFVFALATGTLFVANTWDYPTYLLIVLIALALPMLGTTAARWRGSATPADRAGEDAAAPAALHGRFAAWRDTRLGSWLTQAAALAVLGLLLFLPFQITFKSFAGGGPVTVPPAVAQIPILGTLMTKLSALIGVNIWPKTWQGFITIFGFFLYAVIAFVLVLLARNILAERAAGQPLGRPVIALGAVVAVSWLGALLLQFPLLALLVPLAAAAVYLIGERLQPGHWSSEELFTLSLIGIGALITFGTELFFLQDVFQSRMNTLFKFYYQVWVIWALAAAYATWWLLSRAFAARAPATSPAAGARLGAKALAGAWAAGFALLFGLAMVYPALAPAARDNGVVWVPFVHVANPQDHKLRGLDGIQGLADSAPGDLEAIRWLRANAPATAGIAEGDPTAEFNMQGNNGRVSAYTGMPTILAWTGHEYQWRGGQPQIRDTFGKREADLRELYTTTDTARAQQILHQYGLQYVFVGTIEKGEQGQKAGDPSWQASPAALSKFSSFMQPVFNQDGTTVYRLPGAIASPGAQPGALPAQPGALPPQP